MLLRMGKKNTISSEALTPGPVVTAPPVETVEAPAEPAPWTPSAEIMPHWIVAANRTSWKVKTAPATPKGEQRAQWRGGDIEYTYFKGGDVVARFREGGLYGTLTTEPVPELEKDLEPIETPPTT